MGPLWSGAERYGVLDNPYYRGNLEHTAYDEFWKARAIWKHFKGITPAVLTVGGWFDAEDIAGPLLTYKTLKSDSTTTKSHLVMGPWTHGSWARGDGRVVGNLDFGAEVSAWYREHVEFPFFMQHLKDKTLEPVAEATMFETGTNRWRTFAAWPPQTAATPMYLGARATLSSAAPVEAEAFDQYVSDPNRPRPVRRARADGHAARLHDGGPALRGDAARRAGLYDAAARRGPDRARARSAWTCTCPPPAPIRTSW